ncbi:MAG: hypothetical protein PHR25_02455 [Clostridia bacterium]|nr:hypothetical protein [Clostridia bacterium]MDD4375621.1 hypothetical protein [Clostridia bacterium]
MQKRTGITMISIMIMTVILLTFSSLATISIKNIVEETNIKEFVREYELVKSMTKDYITRKSGEIDFEKFNWDTSIIDDKNSTQFNEEPNMGGIIRTYIIDLEKIDIDKSIYGKGKNNISEEIYLISEDTGEIYYRKGFMVDDNIYYRVTEDLKYKE